jgi:hypothetical protein
MANNRNNNGTAKEDLIGNNSTERHSSRPNDLPDSPRDKEALKAEETFIDLPDVKDIPGQEFVKVPHLEAIGDTTISSADEEGASVFDEDDDEDLRPTGNDADVTPAERKALEDVDYIDTRDENNLRRAAMDNVDFGGEPLNEGAFGEKQSARDLDVPGADDDDTAEEAGAEDEENNNYSLGGDSNDEQESRVDSL